MFSPTVWYPSNLNHVPTRSQPFDDARQGPPTDAIAPAFPVLGSSDDDRDRHCCDHAGNRDRSGPIEANIAINSGWLLLDHGRTGTGFTRIRRTEVWWMRRRSSRLSLEPHASTRNRFLDCQSAPQRATKNESLRRYSEHWQKYVEEQARSVALQRALKPRKLSRYAAHCMLSCDKNGLRASEARMLAVWSTPTRCRRSRWNKRSTGPSGDVLRACAGRMGKKRSKTIPTNLPHSTTLHGFFRRAARMRNSRVMASEASNLPRARTLSSAEKSVLS